MSVSTLNEMALAEKVTCTNCIVVKIALHSETYISVCMCVGASEERRARLTVCGMIRLAAVSGGEFAPHSLKFLYPLSVPVHHHQPVWLLGRREGKREQGYTSTLYIGTFLFAYLASHTGHQPGLYMDSPLHYSVILPPPSLRHPPLPHGPPAPQRQEEGREGAPPPGVHTHWRLPLLW